MSCNNSWDDWQGSLLLLVFLTKAQKAMLHIKSKICCFIFLSSSSEPRWEKSSSHDSSSWTLHSLPNPHSKWWVLFMLDFVLGSFKGTLVAYSPYNVTLYFRWWDWQCGQGRQHPSPHCCPLWPRTPHQHTHHQWSRLHKVCLFTSWEMYSMFKLLQWRGV